MDATILELKERNLMRNHRTVVIGAGRSGLAAARLLLELGADVAVADSGPDASSSRLGDLENQVEFLTGKHSKKQFTGADLVVLSPGVPVLKLSDHLEGIPSRKVVAEIELASWFLDIPILSVTGTNGKTTTTTLISRILEDSGKRIFTGGNIGTPPCEYLMSGDKADIAVLEVSSFQLQTCRKFRPHVGVLLNLSPNHLDYHQDMDEYRTAKLNMFARMETTDAAILPMDMKKELDALNFTRANRHYFQATNRFEAPYLPGEHNKSNMEAAWLAVREFGVTEDQAAKSIKNFQPLDHRVQQLGEAGGVLFVDDSKGTNLDAVLAAINSFDRPMRLLLGGVFKGGNVRELIPAMKSKVVQVGLFGDSREVFESALRDDFPLFWEPTLEAATRKLFNASAPGDVILLSPGTASFDLYSSYADRGNDFQRIFGELA